jgi:hypothetical protein
LGRISSSWCDSPCSAENRANWFLGAARNQAPGNVCVYHRTSQTFFPMVVTTDRSDLCVLRDDIETNVDLVIQGGRSSDVDVSLSQDSRLNVFIHECSCDLIHSQLFESFPSTFNSVLSVHRVRIITFAPRMSEMEGHWMISRSYGTIVMSFCGLKCGIFWPFSGRSSHTVSGKDLSGFPETILNIIPMKVWENNKELIHIPICSFYDDCHHGNPTQFLRRLTVSRIR